MMLPDWAKERIETSLSEAAPVKNGKVTVSFEFNFSMGGLGTIKTAISREESHRQNN